jgi:hypothetical protein
VQHIRNSIVQILSARRFKKKKTVIELDIILSSIDNISDLNLFHYISLSEFRSFNKKKPYTMNLEGFAGIRLNLKEWVAEKTNIKVLTNSQMLSTEVSVSNDCTSAFGREEDLDDPEPYLRKDPLEGETCYNNIFSDEFKL